MFAYSASFAVKWSPQPKPLVLSFAWLVYFAVKLVRVARVPRFKASKADPCRCRPCSSLQPKPVAAHLLTFPLSPLRPRQARRTVLLWLRLRRLVEFHDSDACRHIYPLKYPPWLCQRAFALRAAVEPWTPFPNRPWPLRCYPSPSESTRSNRRGRGSRVPADLTVR